MPNALCFHPNCPAPLVPMWIYHLQVAAHGQHWLTGHADQLDAALLKSAAVEVAQQARAGAVPENQELRFCEQVMAAAAAIGKVPPPS